LCPLIFDFSFLLSQFLILVWHFSLSAFQLFPDALWPLISVLCAAGVCYFRRMEKTFADVI